MHRLTRIGVVLPSIILCSLAPLFAQQSDSKAKVKSKRPEFEIFTVQSTPGHKYRIEFGKSIHVWRVGDSEKELAAVPLPAECDQVTAVSAADGWFDDGLVFCYSV